MSHIVHHPTNAAAFVDDRREDSTTNDDDAARTATLTMGVEDASSAASAGVLLVDGGEYNLPTGGMSTTATSTRCSTLQLLGIPDSIILAPIQLPPRKKRKTNDEFTVLERLEILSELKGPNPISVPNLAAKHRTSRTSIYRWKKDLPRLLQLAKKADGTEHKKRVPIQKKKKKKKRPCSNNNISSSSYYDCYHTEEFSVAQKLNAIREFSTGSNPPSVRSVASKIGANYRALYRWKKDEQKLIKLVEHDGQGDRKRLVNDPMGRVKEALKLFYRSHHQCEQQQQQQQQQQHQLTTSNNTNLTGTLLALKAIQIRDEMLAQHEISPYLSESELRGMKEFTGSASWGRKVLHKLVSMDREEEDDDDDDDDQVDDNMASAVGMMNATATTTTMTMTQQQQQYPPWNASLSPTSKGSKSTPKSTLLGQKQQLLLQQQQQMMKDMKRETTLLKKNLHGSELRVHELEIENAALRAQIASMMMMINGGGSGDVLGGRVGDGSFELEQQQQQQGEEEDEEKEEEEEADEDYGYKEYY